MKKRMLSLMLALCLTFAMAPAALADPSDNYWTDSDIAYQLPGGTIYFNPATGMITRADYNITSADIPSSINGVPVTTIGMGAFFGCTDLTRVTIPDSVTYIDYNAFMNCTSLTDVTMPDGVEYEGNSFVGTPWFAAQSDFGVTDGVLNIYQGDGGDIVLPDGVTSIGPSVFMHNYDLTSVVLPEGVVSIINSAFHDCKNMVSVTLPVSLTNIKMHAFGDCDSLATVYYRGTQAQWEAIDIEGGNEYLLNANIVYNSAPDTPARPVAPPAPAAIAYASTQNVSIDGTAVELQAYALKDAAGNPTNYVKLRDVAYALAGTAAEFEVTWDGNVNIVIGQLYTPNGSEMSTPFSGDRAYTVPTAVTKINGEAKDLAAISLTDDNGGGYTYYQLRDLGRALGFNVGWSAERGIFIETDRPYTDAD